MQSAHTPAPDASILGRSAPPSWTLGAWSPDPSPDADRSQLLAAAAPTASTDWSPLNDLHQSIALIWQANRLALARGGLVQFGQQPSGTQVPLLAWLPPFLPSQLGDARFREDYRLKYNFVTGSMANGIASEALVEAVARAGMLGFFGAAGLSPQRVEAAIDHLQGSLGDLPFGFNLIHSPDEPELEAAIVALYLKRRVQVVEASAFLDVTLPLVRYRTHGIHLLPDGTVATPNRVMAKVSRVEVARRFLQPPPERMLAALVEEGALTPEQARMAATLPLCDDLTAEADSGGHTDNRPLVVLLPLLQSLRDSLCAQHGFTRLPRVGAAGGIGTPEAVAAAFGMGAAYVVTGSINQCTLEAGTSDAVRRLLSEAASTDVTMAPAADMFELGVTVQVLGRGTLFAVRGRKLYDLYKQYDSLESLPPKEREVLEKTYFHTSLEQAWAGCEAYFSERDPVRLLKAQKDPKYKLALLFRSYLGQASRWANAGEKGRTLDYQIWCGPAMGAFNAWVADSPLAPWQARQVVPISLNLLHGAAVLTRAAQLRSQGIEVPGGALPVKPLAMEALEQRLTASAPAAPPPLVSRAALAGSSLPPESAPADGEAVSGATAEPTAEPIAIVGMGCLFPKAQDLQQWWRLLRTGVDAVGEVPPTHWTLDDYFDPDPKSPDKTYASRGAFLDAYPFDPTGFGVPPNILEATDTSQLLSLVVARAALADAGYPDVGSPKAETWDRSRTSVLLGVTGTQELVISLGSRLGHPHWRRALVEAGVDAETTEDVIARIGRAYVGWQENSFPGLLGNVVAGRIANRLNLGGTNAVVDAACASSLAAIHLACLELQARRCDMALSGGVDTLNDIFMYMCFSKTPALSPTGDARPFSARADGTILGEGIGMVVLKRLSDAVRDGNRIYAVMKSIGTSSDGKAKSIYAPLPEGQARALRDAYQQAGVSPSDITLVEAHGTGTKAGDASEFKALETVFREAKPAGDGAGQWCALGSVKSQIGHTKSTAGAAGLMKAALALYHKVLPPTLKVEQPNPALEIHKSPFYLSTQARPWISPIGQARLAGVSAFGFGGSNFHTVLQEYSAHRQETAWDGSVELLAFSDVSVASLRQRVLETLQQLEQAGPWYAQTLAVLARNTRALFRSSDAHRLLLTVVAGQSRAEERLARALKELEQRADEGWSLPDGTFYGVGAPVGTLAVVFPGQGSQYVGMLRDLACIFPEFLQVLEPIPSLANTLYPAPTFDDAERKAQEAALTRTDRAQPALGAVEAALWDVLKRFKLSPSALVGHSFGELTALYAAGCYSRETLLSLAQTRGTLMAGDGGDRGTMLAVMAPLDALDTWLSEAQAAGTASGLVLANRNTPQQGVLSGPREAIEQAEKTLKGKGWSVRRLDVAAAFHSALVAPAEQGLATALESVSLVPTRLPVLANSTAQPYPAEPDAARQLLAGQLARPVRFVESVEALYSDGVRTFLEVGPKAVLSGMIRQTLGRRAHATVALDASSGKKDGLLDLAQALAQLGSLGHPLNLSAWQETGQPLELPKRGKMTILLTGANHREKLAPVPPRVPRLLERERLPEPALSTSHQLVTAPRPAIAAANALEEALPMVAPLAVNKGPVPQASMPPTTYTPVSTQGQPSTPGPQLMQTRLSAPPAAHRTDTNTPIRMERKMVHSPSEPNTGQTYQSLPYSPPSGPPRVENGTGNPHTDLLMEALRTSQEQLRAMQTLQHQTAAVHHRFLEGQELTQRGFLALLEGQQRMIELAMGGGNGVRTLTHFPLPAPSQAVPQHLPAMMPPPLPSQPVRTESPAVPAMVARPMSPPPAPAAVVRPVASAPVSARPAPVPTPAAPQAPAVSAPVAATRANGVSSAPVRNGTAAGASTGGNSAAISASPTNGSLPSGGDIKAALLSVVSELTGYPQDMLELGMDMESDLGIDSIKRVEILSVLSSRLPGAKSVEPEQLSGIKTLGQVMDFLSQGSGTSSAKSGAQGGSELGKSEARVEQGMAGDLGGEGAISPLERQGTMTGSSSVTVGVVPALEVTLQRLAVQPVLLSGAAGLETRLLLRTVMGDDVADAASGTDPEKSETYHLLPPGGVHLVYGESNASRLAAEALKARVLAIAEASRHTVHCLSRREALAASTEGVTSLIFVADPVSAESPVPGARGAGWGEVDEAGLRQDFAVLRAHARALKLAGQGRAAEPDSPRAFVGAVIHLDGCFGFTDAAWMPLDARPAASPLQGGLAGLIKTIPHEWPGVSVRILDVSSTLDLGRAGAPAVDPGALLLEGLAVPGPIELGVARSGIYSLQAIPLPWPAFAQRSPAHRSLQAGDVVLVTGGARGVTAACVLELARQLPLTFVLVGRSPLPGPEPVWMNGLSEEASIKKAILQQGFAGERPTPRQVGEACAQLLAAREVRQTIEALTQSGSTVHYLALDIRDAAALTGALAPIRAAHGPVRALVHGAGVLQDRRIEDKTDAQFEQVFDTKVAGLRVLLDVIRPDPLQAMVLFSSVSGRFGRRGQIDYAIANQVLDTVARRESRLRPECRVVSLGWGPWAGGMVTPGLKKEFEKEGVGLIPVEAGARHLVRELLAVPGGPPEWVVGSSLDGFGAEHGSQPGHSQPGQSQPGQSQPRLLDALTLDVGSQPWLNDHRVGGKAVVPVAMMVSLLAEAARRALPGLEVVRVENFVLFQGIILEAVASQVTLWQEQLVPTSEGVCLELSLRLGFNAAGRPQARARVVLGTLHARRPPSPEKRVKPLLPYPLPVDQIYAQKHLFHGPAWQVISAIEGTSPEGIRLSVVAAPALSQWLSNHPLGSETCWRIDPSWLDGVFQGMILWARAHCQMPCLPGNFERLELHRPATDGAALADVHIDIFIRSRVGQIVLADAHVFAQDGRRVATLLGAKSTLSAGLDAQFGAAPSGSLRAEA